LQKPAKRKSNFGEWVNDEVRQASPQNPPIR